APRLPPPPLDALLVPPVGPARQSGDPPRVGPGAPVQRRTLPVPDRAPSLPAERFELVDPPVPPGRIEKHPFDLAGAGADGLRDRGEAGKGNRGLWFGVCGF